MRHLILSFILLGSLSSTAMADKSLTLEFNTYINRSDELQPTVRLTHRVKADTGAFGGYVYALVNAKYAEAYGGPTLTFPFGKNGFLETGFGIGIEQSELVDDRNPLRLAAHFLIDTKKHLLFGRFETGASRKDFVEQNYYARYAYHAGEHFDLGVMASRYEGVGPRIDFWLKKPHLGIWFAPTYDYESDAFGAILTFSTGY